jgi:hypothetical protein
MKIIQSILAISVMIFFAGCSSLPEILKNPTSPEKSIVAVSITNLAPATKMKSNPSQVYFAKIPRNGNIFKGQGFIAANYVKKDVAYLINIEPGRYVVVATSIPTGMYYRDFSFFKKEAIKASEITVKPRQVAFAGELVIQYSGGLLRSIQDKGDDAQKNYLTFLYNIAKDFQGTLDSHVWSGNFVKRSKTPEDRQEFLEKAKGDLKGTGWEKLLK